MFGQVIDRIAVAFGLKPKITPGIEGIPALCDRSDRNATRMIFIAWVMFVIQLLDIFLFPASVLNNILAAIIVLSSILVIYSFFSANEATRSMAQLAVVLQRTIDAQEVTIEHQRETILSQTEAMGTLRAAYEPTVFYHLIDGIESRGWMWSVGMMNTARRTGPMAFVWRPGVTVVDGKVESVVFTGTGDTIIAALQDAIDKMSNA